MTLSPLVNEERDPSLAADRAETLRSVHTPPPLTPLLIHASPPPPPPHSSRVLGAGQSDGRDRRGADAARDEAREPA